MLTRYTTEPDNNNSIAECIAYFGERLLINVAREYMKLTTSFLATRSTVTIVGRTIITCLLKNYQMT